MSSCGSIRSSFRRRSLRHADGADDVRRRNGAGFYRPTFTVDGSMFNVGRTDNEVDFFYSSDAGPVFLGFRIKNSRDTINYFEAGSGSVPSLPGMAVTGDRATGLTISGSTTFTLNIPIVFRKDDRPHVRRVGWNCAELERRPADAQRGRDGFSSTFKLTGITVTDASGNPLDTFSITSGSGTLYDRNGVVNVPEPTAYASLLFGLLGGVLRKPARPASANLSAPSTQTIAPWRSSTRLATDLETNTIFAV